jgi:hypothetical protein
MIPGVGRPRPVQVTSDMPTDVAVKRLRAALSTHRVRGSVRGRSLRVVAARPRRRNSWTPVLRAEILDRPGGGCEVVGALGWPAMTTVLTLVMALILGFFLLLVVVGTAGNAVTGEWGEVASGLGFLGFLVVFAGFYAGLAWIGGVRWGRQDEQVILNWLDAALDR